MLWFPLHLYLPVGPLAGTLSGASPAVPAFLTASQVPGSVPSSVPQSPGPCSLDLTVAGSALAPQQAASLGGGSSGGPLITQTTAASGHSEPPVGVKEPSALILPNTGLLGIPTPPPVAKIKAVKYIDGRPPPRSPGVGIQEVYRREKGRGQEEEVCHILSGRLDARLCRIHGHHSSH